MHNNSKRKIPGNDIPFSWAITRNKQAEDLAKPSLKVYIEHEDTRKKYPIDALAIKGNTISGIFRGKIQKQYGSYTLHLVENDGENNMFSVDHVNFITLVRHTYEEGGHDCSNLTTDTIEITTDITVPDNGIGISHITKTTSNISGGENVITIHLDNGAQYSFSVFNGQKPVITTDRHDQFVDIIVDEQVIATLQDSLFIPEAQQAVKDYVLSIFEATKGQPNGIASLNDEGTIPTSQLPSTVTEGAEAGTNALKALKDKVDKEEGKGLSTNDLTNDLLQKLNDLHNYNDTEVRNLVNKTQSALDALIGSKDTTKAIDTFNEVIKFLSSFDNTDSLPSVLSSLTKDIQAWVKSQEYLTQHQDLSGYQQTIADLATIREDSKRGASALQELQVLKGGIINNQRAYLNGQMQTLATVTLRPGWSLRMRVTSLSFGASANILLFKKGASSPVATATATVPDASPSGYTLVYTTSKYDTLNTDYELMCIGTSGNIVYNLSWGINSELDALLEKVNSFNSYDDTEVRQLITNVQSALDTLTGKQDTTDVIDTFNEVIKFLNSFGNDDTLSGVLYTLEQNIKDWVEEQQFAYSDSLEDYPLAVNIQDYMSEGTVLPIDSRCVYYYYNRQLDVRTYIKRGPGFVRVTNSFLDRFDNTLYRFVDGVYFGKYAEDELEESILEQFGLRRQSFISDLDTIREGAASGATAIQPEDGKGLSTNDFTNALKSKLESLSNYDDAEVRGLISNVQSALNTLVGSEDTTTAIDTFNEVISFLDTFKGSDSLASALATLKTEIQTWVENKKYLTKHQDLKTINGETIVGSGNIEVKGVTDFNELENKPKIPSKTSDLTNDSGFVKDSNYVHTDNNYTNADKENVAKVGELSQQVNTIDKDVEVIDANVLALNEAHLIYGVIINEEQSSPTLQRVGNLDLHVSLPVQSLMRRCLLNDDGSVNYYLNANDSTLKEDGTPAVLDGTDGMVMVEMPRHFRRLKFIDATRYRVDISLYPFKDAIEIPQMYVSAWEATVDRSNGNMLASVVNTDVRYRGGNNQSAWDGTYRSVLGMPATSISLTNYRAYARKRGDGWNCYEYRAHLAIFWFYTIEYATLNSQATYNANLTAEGYHQGGMGAGVTNITSANWNTYNSYYPFIPCGFTASLGNNTGIVPFSFNDEQAEAYGGAFTTNVPSYRGIENPFGHIFKWTDGVMFDIHADSDTGESRACKPTDTSEYGDTSKQVPFGTIPRASGYTKKMNITPYAEIIPSENGGGSTTYFCDYFYTSSPTSGNSWRGLLLGGYANIGTSAGLAFVYSSHAASSASAYCGSRLCFCQITKL